MNYNCKMKKKAFLTNDVGITGCPHGEYSKSIHIYRPAQDTPTSGSKLQHKSSYPKADRRESWK